MGCRLFGAFCGPSKYDITPGMKLTRVFIVFVAFLTLAGLVAGCGGSISVGDDQSKKTIYDDTAISVTAGTSFGIELPVNPSTGYSWKVTLPEGYTEDSHEVVPVAEADADKVGVATTEQWMFTTETAGTADIVFELFPPGSDTAEQDVTFTVTAT